jgi:hypothetical protein
MGISNSVDSGLSDFSFFERWFVHGRWTSRRRGIEWEIFGNVGITWKRWDGGRMHQRWGEEYGEEMRAVMIDYSSYVIEDADD